MGLIRFKENWVKINQSKINSDWTIGGAIAID